MSGEFIFRLLATRKRRNPSEMKKSETDNGVLFFNIHPFLSITSPRDFLSLCTELV